MVCCQPALTAKMNNMVGCFDFSGPLRQYFSLYRAVSQRGRRRERIDERKMSKQSPSEPTASTSGQCPTIIQSSRTPRHWKFYQAPSHHPTTPKIYNMTVMVRSLVMTSLSMCVTNRILLPRVSCPYSNTRYITNLSKSVIFIVQLQLYRYSHEWDLIST